jgi:small subunit ribosomal protein S4e
MSVKGGKRHVKKRAAPSSWPLPRKGDVWTTKPAAGAHGTEESMALLTIVRDMLKLTDNSREAKKLIKAGEILIDGKVVSDPSYAVGLMDVVTIPKNNSYYRVIYDKKSRIALQTIGKAESSFKLCRIEDKLNTKKGRTTLGLHDGRNIVVEKGEYRPGDVLKMAVPKQKIMERFALEAGATAFVIGGAHAGMVGKITEVRPGTMMRDSLVSLESDGEKFVTPKRLIFIVGKESSEIKIGA